jgi:hypothetical protein
MQSILLKLLFIDMFQVVVANAGDAKAVLARSTSTDGEVAVVDTKSLLKAIVLTREHKAIFPQERSRIQKVNRYVVPTFSSVVPPNLSLVGYACSKGINSLVILWLPLQSCCIFFLAPLSVR